MSEKKDPAWVLVLERFHDLNCLMFDCGSASGLLVAFYVCFFLLKFESKVMRNFQNDTEMAMIIGPDVEPLRVPVFY